MRARNVPLPQPISTTVLPHRSCSSRSRSISSILKRGEGRRKRLRFFVGGIVAQARQIERGIRDEAAVLADGDPQIAARKRAPCLVAVSTTRQLFTGMSSTRVEDVEASLSPQLGQGCRQSTAFIDFLEF